MKKYLTILLCTLLSSCEYLDVVPDNVSTIEHAFANEVTTERYLLTCYAGLPADGSISQNPAFMGSDEFWTTDYFIGAPDHGNIWRPYQIQIGQQNTNAPLLNYYEGLEDGVPLYKTIRKCNIFLSNIDGVPHLPEKSRKRWIAEAKFIKAYCHYYLLRMYGPIPIVDAEIAIDSKPEDVRLMRNTFDECVDYIVNQLDEASLDLPLKIYKLQDELGRITIPIAKSLKAKVLTMSASPLFNGNSYYTDFANKDGKLLFSGYEANKWDIAAKACKEAIDVSEEAGAKLYEYSSLASSNEAHKMERTIRGSVTSDDWCDELIWGGVVGQGGNMQKYMMPNYLLPGMKFTTNLYLVMGVSLKIAKQYYTSNGIPIEEDPTWNTKKLTQLRTSIEVETDYIDGTTAELNFDREPRFYASLGFDRGTWYGNGQQEKPFVLKSLFQEQMNQDGYFTYSTTTGYYVKKFINMKSEMSPPTSFSPKSFPFPLIRLSDMYLLYAECLNESKGPSPEAIEYIDKVRTRAKLKGVTESWANSINPSKPKTKEGLRSIIQTERMIELALEGQRFWDLRRWLLTETIGAEPVLGWNVNGTTPEEYYQEVFRFKPSFHKKDYLWPIREYLLTVNPNLVQTKGW